MSSVASDRKSRTERHRSSRASGVRAESGITTSSDSRSPTSRRFASCGRRGASSRTTCALVPPKPKELTPAVAGPSVSGQASSPRDPQREGIEVDVGVRAGEVEARGDRAVVQGQGRLDQPGDAGRGLEVPDVGLHRAERAGTSRVASLAEHGPQRGELDGIAERRAGAVGLDIVDPPRVDSGVPVGRASTASCADRLGAVRPLVRPSWLTAPPRITA